MDIGITSVTFRSLDYETIIKYCVDCGIKYIGWGSDVHVLPGDIEMAKKVYDEMIKNNLVITSYESYYTCCKYENPQEEFKKYLETCRVLCAPVIRIWAGNMDYEKGGEEYFNKVVNESKMLCDMAKEYGVTVAYECHSSTLTYTSDCSLRLLKAVNKDNIGIYFQDELDRDLEYNLDAIEKLSEYIKMIHAFCFEKRERVPFDSATGKRKWTAYFNKLKENNVDKNVLLEFLLKEEYDELKKEKNSLFKYM